ncbi:hypothetical protein BDF14DRAFT_1862112 [Spinellus fusiger]|nr:hypothetical protein BDF14DRAFT_1862112 [Spinellus fusiger]
MNKESSPLHDNHGLLGLLKTYKRPENLFPSSYSFYTMTPPTRAHTLSLYRQFIRHGKKFQSYNFKEYTLRRSHDAFHLHKAETDPHKITALLEKAEHDLAAVKRQAAISTLYATGSKLVIEK